VSGRLYEALGLLSGFILIDYGFNFIATGIHGAREFTSQFLGANFLVGGSAIVFVSLYFLLKPEPQVAKTTQPAPVPPDVRVGLVVEEATPPKPGFYKNIEYIGYFFAFLGLISAADLVLQVFIRSTYDELRWWVEVLLVVFGVLSYTILGSIGHLGAQEEAKLMSPPTYQKFAPEPSSAQAAPTQPNQPPTPKPVETLTLNLAEFSKSATGEYERHVSGSAYDMFRVDRDLVTVWREERKGMRSVYLAGPYELNRKLLEEQVRNGLELTIGNLTLTVDTIRTLLELEHPAAQSTAPATN
jgi:hypothetical protein